MKVECLVFLIQFKQDYGKYKIFFESEYAECILKSFIY